MDLKYLKVSIGSVENLEKVALAEVFAFFSLLIVGKSNLSFIFDSLSSDLILA
jgi:hypothetical protein